LEKEEEEEESVEREREAGEPDCEDKLGLGLSLGIGPPPPSERWLPPSPLYSAPFLNGSPQPSPPPSLGAQPGPLETAPRGSWLEEELRGLGDAALQLGDRVEKSLVEFGEGFRRDMRTLVASQELLASSLQQNNILLQRLLGVLESQQQTSAQRQCVPPPPPAPQSQAHVSSQQQHQPLQPLDTQQSPGDPPQDSQPAPDIHHHLHVAKQPSPYKQPTAQQPKPFQHLNDPSAAAGAPQASPAESRDTLRSDRPAAVNGAGQRSRRGRTVEHRRRRRR